KNTFFKSVKDLIRADGKYSLNEFIYYALLEKYLSEKQTKRKLQLSTLMSKKAECIYVLSLLAQVGNKTDEARENSFFLATKAIFGSDIELVKKEKLSIGEFE